MINEELLISHVSKSFGENIVLNDFSAEFYTGFNLLSGSSGVGKTTLLRIIAGLESMDDGMIFGAYGNMTFMFQEDRLLPWLSATENISCIMDKSIPKEEISVLLSDLMIEKEDQLKYPSELSGGMKRRVSLARAIIYAAHFGGNIVLLDEPFKGLDPDTMHKVISVCREYLSDKIVIVVSHEITSDTLGGANVVYM